MYEALSLRYVLVYACTVLGDEDCLLCWRLKPLITEKKVEQPKKFGEAVQLVKFSLYTLNS